MKETIILSVYYGHNATVGLSINSRMVCVLSEERLVRIKNATGFPYQALKYVTQTYLNGELSKVDKVILNDERLYGYQYLQRKGFKPKVGGEYYNQTKKQTLQKDLN